MLVGGCELRIIFDFQINLNYQSLSKLEFIVLKRKILSFKVLGLQVFVIVIVGFRVFASLPDICQTVITEACRYSAS